MVRSASTVRIAVRLRVYSEAPKCPETERAGRTKIDVHVYALNEYTAWVGGNPLPNETGTM